MKTYLLWGGVALATLAVPAFAQEEVPAAYPESSGLDVPVDDGPNTVAPAPATAAPTGDPVLDRLNVLEARLRQLEARNAELEAANSEVTTRVQNVEVRAATAVQAGPAPTFSDVPGSFTFKPRGVLQVDYAGYNERAGGYDYNNGTDIRRARFGFDGTAFKIFKWRLEAEYVKGAVNLLDAYVSYAPSPKWLLTVGQHKAPFGLEANSSDSFNTFLERGMFNTAFGAVGAERRVGASAGYVSDQLNVTAGIFGASEAVQRDAATPDEAYSGNIRATWEPILDTGKVVHVGASAFLATNFAGNTLSNIGDRPNTRVDGGRIIQATIAGTNPATGPQTGAKDATFLGAEAGLVFGPFSAQAEYGRLTVDRFGTAKSVRFDGFYAFGSWFVTGESRSFKNGNVDRLKPFTDFDGKGGLGALELAVRYDKLDLTDIDLSPLERKAHSWTGAVNWYLNPNTKLLFNYIRFTGTNSPLVVAPVSVYGTTAKGDAFATRLHFDF
jgi:phosphate-selective porin OprO/OprP